MCIFCCLVTFLHITRPANAKSIIINFYRFIKPVFMSHKNISNNIRSCKLQIEYFKLFSFLNFDEIPILVLLLFLQRNKKKTPKLNVIDCKKIIIKLKSLDISKSYCLWVSDNPLITISCEMYRKVWLTNAWSFMFGLR